MLSGNAIRISKIPRLRRTKMSARTDLVVRPDIRVPLCTHIWVSRRKRRIPHVVAPEAERLSTNEGPSQLRCEGFPIIDPAPRQGRCISLENTDLPDLSLRDFLSDFVALKPGTAVLNPRLNFGVSIIAVRPTAQNRSSVCGAGELIHRVSTLHAGYKCRLLD